MLRFSCSRLLRNVRFQVLRQKSTSVSLHSRRIPHIIEPRLLLGTATATTLYVFYLWFFDDDKPPPEYPNSFLAVVHRRLPSNAYSHFVGLVADTNVPSVLRPFVFGACAKFMKYDMTEAKESDLRKYATFGQLFNRELAPGVRPIDTKALINSPADGTVVHIGPVESEKGLLEQVKGITFSMAEFLGPTDGLLRKKSGRLYQCIIYLSPSDYHRFHAPADWIVEIRRHFPGKLLSVRPSFIKNLPGVFVLNERVVYLGEWKHGFMSLTAVGAAGVGSVVAADNIDPTLSTNRSTSALERHEPGQHFEEISLGRVNSPLGTPFGQFKLGSTIVLVFEAPAEGYVWSVQPGDRIKYGAALMAPSSP